MRSIEFEHFWTPVLDISVEKNVAEILKDSGNFAAPPMATIAPYVDESDRMHRIQRWNIRHRI